MTSKHNRTERTLDLEPLDTSDLERAFRGMGPPVSRQPGGLRERSAAAVAPSAIFLGVVAGAAVLLRMFR